MFLTANREISTARVSSEFPQTSLRNQPSPGHSGLQTTSDSPEGPLFQNPIRQNSEQYYLCVCVYIYYIANEQIAAMWHGLVAWLLKKEKHTQTHTHTLKQTHSHIPTTRPPVFSACLSISSCGALGWE